MTDDDLLVEWFRGHYAAARQVERRLWEMHDQLFGGAIAGQSSGHTVMPSFTLKYEIEGGFLVVLSEFNAQHLANEWTSRLPLLAECATVIDAARSYIEEHQNVISHESYDDSPMSQEARELLQHAAITVSAVIGRATTLLVERT